ncbi:MAG: nucleotide sugar dehydrogenase [Sandaracinaceae bacterium]|nr:nucleotide sugar dehydrogenase [Sandaracinaceae bacterium]
MSARLEGFEARVADRSLRVCVVGLGYVGLPVAVTFASAGFRVVGLERDEPRAHAIARGECPIGGDEPGLAPLLVEQVLQDRLTATTDARLLHEADVVIVCVETPVEADHHRPAYRALEAATRTIGGLAREGALVIVESTLSPGTMERRVRHWLEEAGKKVGVTLAMGHCPERVMPGRLLANLRTMSRVCGGDTPRTAAAMRALYATIVQAELDEASCVVAELTKTAENTYRDVNIAFANELARVCEAVGADFLEVRSLVNKSPGRNVLVAGLGVGGHCIPKDPWLFAAAMHERASPEHALSLVPAARAANEQMPLHVSELVEEALAAQKRALAGACVAVLGYAYSRRATTSATARARPSSPRSARVGPRCASTIPSSRASPRRSTTSCATQTPS